MNGFGERVGLMNDCATTNNVLDQAVGLTQVLQDGENSYLYSNGHIVWNAGSPAIDDVSRI